MGGDRFHRRVDNLIGSANGQRVNSDERVDVDGADLSLRLHLGERWLLSTSYTHSEAEDSSNRQVAGIPTSLAKLGLDFASDTLPVEFNISAPGPAMFTPICRGISAAGSTATIPWSMSACCGTWTSGATTSLGLRLENALDEDYASSMGRAFTDREARPIPTATWAPRGPSMQTIASRSRLRPLGRAWWWRYTLLAHRYAGIAVGLVVTLWCLSGVVMMYMPLPRAGWTGTNSATLEPLVLGRCCNGRLHRSLSELPLAPGFRVEMLQGSVLLRIPSPQGQHLYDLSQGRWVETWPRETLLAQGHHFGPPCAAGPRRSAPNPWRWTSGPVYSRYHPHRPLLKFANRDGQQWYVSSRSAETVQATTAHERFWNWLGAVPHWLYPTLLRKHTALWAAGRYLAHAHQPVPEHYRRDHWHPPVSPTR